LRAVCDEFYVETVLLVDDIILNMAIERSVKNLLLLVLAFLIVVVLWRTIWFLGGLAVFAIVVYFVYLLLKGNI
jgi:hypothetical protein